MSFVSFVERPPPPEELFRVKALLRLTGASFWCINQSGVGTQIGIAEHVRLLGTMLATLRCYEPGSERVINTYVQQQSVPDVTDLSLERIRFTMNGLF